MTGWIPAFRRASSVSSVSGLTPENPFARQLARRSIRARTATSESGSPTPAAWLRTRFSWSAASFSRGMTTSANFPKPVVTP